jgi:two-component system phosphate regulon response regulator PhoB
VQCAGTGVEGVRKVEEALPDLVLLDLILPDLCGVDVCRTLKDKPVTAPIPIIMLTARNTEQDRVAGFEAGASDYLAKPFSLRELILRIDVALGRGPHRGSARECVGRLRIDRMAYRAWVDEAECSLTTIEFRLLLSLFDAPDRVRTRAELLRDVWGLEGDAVTRTVDTHVKRLRGKLGRAGTYVETVRGVGYRFVGR